MRFASRRRGGLVVACAQACLAVSASQRAVRGLSGNTTRRETATSAVVRAVNAGRGGPARANCASARTRQETTERRNSVPLDHIGPSSFDWHASQSPPKPILRHPAERQLPARRARRLDAGRRRDDGTPSVTGRWREGHQCMRCPRPKAAECARGQHRRSVPRVRRPAARDPPPWPPRPSRPRPRAPGPCAAGSGSGRRGC